MTEYVRFPLRPLVERYAWQVGKLPEDVSTRELAAAIGVQDQTVRRWMTAGDTLPGYAADRLAVALGWHPCVIWPREWADL